MDLLPVEISVLDQAVADRSFDFGRRDADPVVFLQDLVRSARLAVDPDQIVFCVAAADLAVDELSYGHSIFDFDVIGESTAIVIDAKNSHFCPFEYLGFGVAESNLPIRPDDSADRSIEPDVTAIDRNPDQHAADEDRD